MLNSSSLSSFAVTYSLDVLKRCYDEVLVPQAVRTEFSVRFAFPRGLRVWTLTDSQKIAANQIGIGPGENEAIILAHDLMLPLIIDDTEPYVVAKRLGIQSYRSLQFLRAAYRSCHISRMEYDPLLDNFDTTRRADAIFVQWARQAAKVAYL